MLEKLDWTGLDWYNFNNAFYRDTNGRSHIAQSGVGGDYGLPKDPKDLFVFDHHTFSETQCAKEAYLYGETDDLENIPEEFDIVPDWITIEKLKAKMRFLKSQGYETNSSGVDIFLKDKHKAEKKFNKVKQKCRTDKNGFTVTKEYVEAEKEYERKFHPDMTIFFGKSE
jgi:hypothetical protein